MIEQQLVREPRPELAAETNAAVQAALDGVKEVVRAYLVCTRRSGDDEPVRVVTNVALELRNPPVDEPLPFHEIRRLLAAVATALADRAADVAVVIPAARALPPLVEYAVLAYEREAA